MPGMDGLELGLADLLRPALAGTPLVLLTSGPDVTRPRRTPPASLPSPTKPVLLSRLRTVLRTIVATATAGPGAEPPPSRPGSPPHRRGSVLVVEDGEINQLVATGILESLGYTSPSPTTATRPRRARAVDVRRVLMDMRMPNLGGYGATAEIRVREGRPAARDHRDDRQCHRGRPEQCLGRGHGRLHLQLHRPDHGRRGVRALGAGPVGAAQPG